MNNQDNTTLLDSVAKALAQADQPHASFQAVDKALAMAVGHKIFTICACQPGDKQARRLYTNWPDVYPAGGSRPVPNRAWVERVIDQGQPFIGRNSIHIREIFYDHDVIASLGCQSVINMPVRWEGRTRGVINLLHQENWYNELHIQTVRIFAQLILPALMLTR